MMNEQQILDAVGAGESRDWEFKSAKGGIPGNLWETYSAMANTDGGTIVLGVGEKQGVFSVEGLEKTEQVQGDFWNTVNNRGKVSANLLSNADVGLVDIGGKKVLVIRVPRATRKQRPVFVGQNPLTGTHRRNYEGDYRCPPEEVGRMLADQSDDPADGRVLEHFTLADLDPDSLRQYRNRFSARTPTHPWLALDERGLLEKLGGWRTDRVFGTEGLTVAGLLMFGKDEAIRDPAGVPQYHVDYREHLTDDPQVRWTDRLTIDGTWVGNLFQFYQRVIVRLFADLKVPFQLGPDLFRRDDTIVHEAVREALVNALIHADYRGMGGVVIEKFRDRFDLSNPGSLLLSLPQMLRGGVSECRNKLLQQMFQMIGGGEKAGSGIDKIRQGWVSQKWQSPTIQETTQPDRVRLVLPLVSILPEESLTELKQVFGRRFDGLGPLEVQTLVTALHEGSVSNSRLRLESSEHATDLTRMLQGLVVKGFLEQRGQKRGAFYVLRRPRADSSQSNDSTHKDAGDSAQIPGDSTQIEDQTPHISDEDSTQMEFEPELVAIAQPAREKGKLPADQMKSIILDLCNERFLTPRQLGGLLQRSPVGLQQNYLRELTQQRKLQLRHPAEPNHPDQAYTTKK